MYLFWNIISKKEGSIIMIIERKEYLEKLIAWKDKQLIKIVTGVRRCGKSMLLEIYRNYLKEHGIEEEQIISINFEKLRVAFSLLQPANKKSILKLKKVKKLYRLKIRH